jgi:hypothetical protein
MVSRFATLILQNMHIFTAFEAIKLERKKAYTPDALVM